ncbi:hypothetical protein Nepgr_000004 [Nepenthes gracilis]|uniref:Uncharacterized protein n=1 Tax=Nepenthes gracilis TaxID=150966 RepID=A0AAD3P3V4_NEPGR|nr:hypothetical protein Nepgr_000004 [Nepenthes gracilis]
MEATFFSHVQLIFLLRMVMKMQTYQACHRYYLSHTCHNKMHIVIYSIHVMFQYFVSDAEFSYFLYILLEIVHGSSIDCHINCEFKFAILAMLQWMGGSRRKVTTSRKSTQKRQKQFFEQRKRRQQQQMTMVMENYADRLNNCNQHQENNRSLDILSLLNVPKVSEECRSICPRELNASPLNCCMTEDMPQLATDKFTPANSLESTRLGTLSSCQVENVSPERLPLGASNSSKYAYMERVNNLKDCNIASSHRHCRVAHPC